MNGRRVPKDEVEAVKWYRRAAEQGDADGQMWLWGMYHDGEGVPKDEVEALKWVLLAAAQGDEYAKFGAPSLRRLLTPEQCAEAERRAREFKPSQSK